jgi:hypothetical protein
MIEEGNSRLVEIEGGGWLDRKNRVCMLVKNTNMGKSKDIVKPASKDIQYRLVLEVPIGGIFKFSQNERTRNK